MSSTHHPETVYLAYPLSKELKDKAFSVIHKMKHSKQPKKHVNELIQLIMELTDAAIDYFYYHPVELAKVDIVGKNAVNLGLKAAKKGVNVIARKVVTSMNDKQLLIIVNFIQSVLLQVVEDDEEQE